VNRGVRWVRFNLVGAGGFLFQLAVLWALVHWTPMPAWLAVAVAVVATVSHNFAWHERVTWPKQPAAGRLRRWCAFQTSNGLISLATNVALTPLAAHVLGISIVAANVVAVVAVSIVNFFVSDRWVFAVSDSSLPVDPAPEAQVL